jgi:hypothetical protein
VGQDPATQQEREQHADSNGAPAPSRLRRRIVRLSLIGVVLAGGITTGVVATHSGSTQRQQPPPPSRQTTAAPSEPEAISGSFDPATFDWSTVGAPSGGLVSVGGTGDVVVKKKGQVVDGIKSKARIVTRADGIRLSDCDIGTFHADTNDLLAKHCTINGGVYGEGSYTLEYNFITSQGDGIDPTGQGHKIIQYNKIWRDGTRVGDKHQDGIQFWQGGNTVITRNWIGGFGTSAIMVKADHGPISNVVIDSNYLDNPTGYFQLYLCPQSHGLSYITVTNNAFGKATSVVSTCRAKLTYVHTEEQRQAAIKAGNGKAASWIVWNNNYVASTHAVVPPPGGWAE